jgi:hypothetical protein
MTTPNGHSDKRPKHFIDETAVMPAITPDMVIPPGKHARPDTAELRAQPPRPPRPNFSAPAPLPSLPPPAEPHPPIPPRTRAEDRKAQRPGWFRRYILGEK